MSTPMLPRRFFCQLCRKEEYPENNTLPAGWLSMIRSNGEPGDFRRLGLFCSFDCLIANVPRIRYELERDEEDHYAPTEYSSRSAGKRRVARG